MNKGEQHMGKRDHAALWITRIPIIPGAWLVVSPWVLGFAAANPALTGNDVVGGIVLVVLVVVELVGRPRMPRLGTTGILLLSGTWLGIAAALYGHGSGAAFWNNLVSGVVLVLL